MKDKHLHPIMIGHYLFRFVFLLIIPVIQAFITHSRGTFFVAEIVALILIITFALCQYFSCTYHITEKALNFQKGFFTRQNRCISSNNFNSAIIHSSPILAVAGAAQLHLDTPAGNKKDPDILLTLSKKKLNQFWKSILTDSQKLYNASNWRILLMASAWSNPASGLILAAALLQRTGKIVGNEFENQIYQTFDFRYRLIAWGVPPTTAALAYLLLAGWAVAFLHQFIQYANFSVSQLLCHKEHPFLEECAILIERGFLIKNRQILSRKAICAISIRQTFIMRLFKLYSVYLHTLGSGKEKSDQSLLLAAADKLALNRNLIQLFPQEPEQMQELRVSKKTVRSFLFGPTINLILLFSLVGIVQTMNSNFTPLLFFLLPFIVWQYAIHFYASKGSKISIGNKNIIASSYLRFSLYTAIIPIEKLQCVQIIQNPFQRLKNRCTLKLFIGAEKRSCLAVYHLDKPNLLQLLEQLNNKKEHNSQ